jgi:hypothetical protein
MRLKHLLKPPKVHIRKSRCAVTVLLLLAARGQLLKCSTSIGWITITFLLQGCEGSTVVPYSTAELIKHTSSSFYALMA